MSLDLINSFVDDSGSVPKTALTVVSKKDDEINARLPKEIAIIKSSNEEIVELQSVLERIRKEGMSRAVAERIMEVAPSAMPVGYGIESFTIEPSRVCLNAGVEGITGYVIEGLKRLIAFLIDKAKKAVAWIVDAYRKFTGISPTAYKIERRAVYMQQMSAEFANHFGSDIAALLEDEIKEGFVDIDATRVTLTGLFADASVLQQDLSKYAAPINSMSKQIEALLADVPARAVRVNAIVNDITVARNGNPDRSAEVLRYIDTQKLDALIGSLRSVAKLLANSPMYKSPGTSKEGKVKQTILDQLNSNGFREMMSGLSMAANAGMQHTMNMTDASAIIRSRNLTQAVNELTNYEEVKKRSLDDLKSATTGINSNKYIQAAENSSGDDPTINALVQFNQYFDDVTTAVKLAQDITASYAETVFKLQLFAVKCQDFALIQWAETPESAALRQANEATEKAQEKIKQYIDKVVKNTSGLGNALNDLNKALSA
jgi:hypothetical protein